MIHILLLELRNNGDKIPKMKNLKVASKPHWSSEPLETLWFPAEMFSQPACT